MSTEIVVPTLGESVTEATVGKWFKKPGDAVKADEALAELETDKVTLEVNAPVAGVISEIVVKEGETVAVGAILGAIAEGQAAAPKNGSGGAPEQPARAPEKPQPTPQAQSQRQPEGVQAGAPKSPEILAPSVRRIAEETGIDATRLSGTGKDGRVTKGDMLSAVEGGARPSAEIVSFGQPSPMPAPSIRTPAIPSNAAREE